MGVENMTVEIRPKPTQKLYELSFMDIHDFEFDTVYQVGTSAEEVYKNAVSKTENTDMSLMSVREIVSVDGYRIVLHTTDDVGTATGVEYGDTFIPKPNPPIGLPMLEENKEDSNA
jgi:hypothetical protein